MKKFVLAALLVFFALPAAAHSYKLGDLHIGHVWALATTPKATMGAAYLPIENAGKEDDILKSADTPDAEKIEFHESKTENGVSKMRSMDDVAIAAGKKTEFKPGGKHLMLVGLKKQLKAGDHVKVTLHFAKAGDITVDAHVQKGVMHEHDMEGMSGMGDMHDHH